MIFLPQSIRNSLVLTAAHIQQLQQLTSLPSEEEINQIASLEEVASILDATIGDKATRETALQHLAIAYLDKNEAYTALQILLY